jgi:hypothetical protein
MIEFESHHGVRYIQDVPVPMADGTISPPSSADSAPLCLVLFLGVVEGHRAL